MDSPSSLNSNLNTPTQGTGSLKTNSYFTMSECRFIIKGGWCKITGIFTCNKSSDGFVVFYQKVPSNIFGNDYYNTAISSGDDSIRLKFETDGTIMALGGVAGNVYRFSCVYPVE